MRIFLILIFACNSLFSQDFLDEDKVFNHLQKLHFNRAKNEIKQYDLKKQSRLLYLLPTFSLNTVFIDDKVHFGPSFSLNITSFLKFTREVRKDKALKQMIKANSSMDFQDNYKRYLLRKSLYLKYLKNKEDLKEVLKLKAKIFKIEEEKYKSKKMNIDDFYKSKIEYMKYKEKLNNIDYQLLKIEIEIKELIRF